METYIIILLCIASFIAGFIDAIVGGGGLIQTPAALILLPNLAFHLLFYETIKKNIFPLPFIEFNYILIARGCCL